MKRPTFSTLAASPLFGFARGRELQGAIDMNAAIKITAILILSLVLTAPKGSAATVVFFDPTLLDGDQISTAGDVVSAQLDFDIETGAFKATWQASSAHPFQADLVLNLNLGNTRLGG